MQAALNIIVPEPVELIVMVPTVLGNLIPVGIPAVALFKTKFVLGDNESVLICKLPDAAAAAGTNPLVAEVVVNIKVAFGPVTNVPVVPVKFNEGSVKVLFIVIVIPAPTAREIPETITGPLNIVLWERVWEVVPLNVTVPETGLGKPVPDERDAPVNV